ncbi:MAG: GntR family transcriptional regulator [Mycoplasmatales bacterium]
MLVKNEALYLQVYNIIKEQIIAGKYPVGSVLPTEVEFSNKFDVSLITVRKAMELLQNEHYVEKKSGLGTKVINSSVISSLSTGASFTTILESKYDSVVKEVFDVNLIDIDESPFESGKCTHLKRTYKLDGVPYIFMSIYINDDITKEDIKSLYHVLYSRGYKFSLFNDKFKVDIGNNEIESFLNKKGPFLKRTRITYLDNGNPIEIAEAYYDTDVNQYEYDFLTR